MADAPTAIVTPPAVPAMTYPDLLIALGFNPDAVQAVVVTSTAAYAIAPDYPEPHNPPAPEVPETTPEATDGD